MSKNLMTEPINRFFYGYLSKQREYIELAENANDAYGSTINVENLIGVIVRESFQAGARWQLHETAKLSPYISQFLEMCILLGPDAPRDVWVEATDVMPQTIPVDTYEYHDTDFAIAELRDDIPF